MATHIFDVEIAQEVGVNAAVLFQNIVFWCQRNEANGENIFEGRAWTYNSNKALSVLFPYMTADQIRRGLEKLQEVGLIGVGSFSKDARDRTKWFCVLRQMHLASAPNGAGNNANSYKDTDVNTDINKKERASVQEPDLFTADDTPDQPKVDLEAKFQEFWAAYPVKSGKPAAQKNFLKAVKAGTDPDQIIQGAARYRDWLANAPKGEFRPQPKYPQGWLTDERWNDLPADDEIDPHRARLREITRQAQAAECRAN